MSRFIEGANRYQSSSFPERVDDYVDQDGVIRVIDAFIDRLDIPGLGFKAEPAETGRPEHTRPLVYKIAALVLFLFFTQVQAATNETIKTNEKYDGTVDSFRWLKNPLRVSDASIQSEDGKRIFLSQYKGKIVLLNLWASWCAPCVRELPLLDRLQQRLGSEDFVVVAVSVDSEAPLARQLFIDQLSIKNLKFYIEPVEQLGQFFPVDVLPSSFIINREGDAMGLLRSYVDWDDPRADTLIKRLVAGVTAATLRAEKGQ